MRIQSVFVGLVLFLFVAATSHAAPEGKKFCTNSTAELSVRPAFVSAMVIVYGDKPEMLTCERLKKWAAFIGSSWLSDGLKFSEAVDWVKQILEKEANGAAAGVIANAYLEVYGPQLANGLIGAGPLEKWRYKIMAGAAWYITIVTAEKKSLNSNKAERTSMVYRAYWETFGRAATADELDYWMPRNEHYSLLASANRAWLYSPSGGKDLTETVARAIAKKTGKAPAAAEIKSAITMFIPTKKIYSEMIK